MLLEHNINVFKSLEETFEQHNCCCVVMGTGCGKTYVASEYLDKYNLKALVVSPRYSINESWENHRKDIDTITYQKLANTYNNIDFSKYDILICDEVHHIGALKWGAPIKYLIDNNIIKVLGLTESSIRYTDGGKDVAVDYFYGNVVYGENVSSAIEKKILNPVVYVGAMYNSDGLKKTLKGKIQSRLYAKLNLTLNTTPTIADILRTNMLPGKRKGIIFASTIEDIKSAMSFVKSVYPDVDIRVVHSKQSDTYNKETFEWFKHTDEGYICSVDMISEGVHIKGVNTLIMLRRTESVNLFNQQLGRCLDANSKEPAILFDLVNNKCSIKIIKNKIRIKTNSIVDSSRLNIVSSEQLIVKDYTKDIVEVLEEIKQSLDRKWTEEEIEIVKKYYPIEGIKCYKRLNGIRTSDAVRGLVDRLNLKCDFAYIPYTSQEKELLERLVKEGKPLKEIATILNRPHSSIINASLAFREKNPTRFHWTEDEINILKEKYPVIGVDVIKFLPGKTENAISKKASYLKLKKQDTSYHFTKEDDEYILSNWGSKTLKEIYIERFAKVIPYNSLHYYVYHKNNWDLKNIKG